MTPLSIGRHASQLADVFLITDASGINIYSGFTKDGSLFITNPTASAVPLTITGATSQTANLTEWKTSSGIVIARITSSGQFYTNTVQSTGALTIYSPGTGLSPVLFPVIGPVPNNLR